MESQSDDSRSFLIEHKCNSTFVIDTDTFLSAYGSGSFLSCPGCREALDHDLTDQLLDFLARYRNLNAKLDPVGWTIREIDTEEPIV